MATHTARWARTQSPGSAQTECGFAPRRLAQAYNPDAHLPHHTGIHLTGSCRDLLGRRHEIDERTVVENRWEMFFQGQWITGDPPSPQRG